MALREDLLPVFQDARVLIQGLGLRTHRVIRRIITWSGEGVMRGQPTPTDVEILPRPKVRETPDGYEITKITPVFSGGGYTLADINPILERNQQLTWIIIDPDSTERRCIFAAGTKALLTDRNFGYSFNVVHLDRTAPL